MNCFLPKLDKGIRQTVDIHRQQVLRLDEDNRYHGAPYLRLQPSIHVRQPIGSLEVLQCKYTKG